jgi:hypothetical protein
MLGVDRPDRRVLRGVAPGDVRLESNDRRILAEVVKNRGDQAPSIAVPHPAGGPWAPRDIDPARALSRGVESEFGGCHRGSDRLLRSSDDADRPVQVMRSRSEYRMSPIRIVATPVPLAVVQPDEQQRDLLAALMLDAYRNTIDDEGESFEDACGAIDDYLTSIVRPHSFVMLDGSDVMAFAFVVVVNDVHYIDPVVVASARKRLGLGGDLVRRCLGSLADAGIPEVGATITDGNVASERLFTGLGFHRHGPWI